MVSVIRDMIFDARKKKQFAVGAVFLLLLVGVVALVYSFYGKKPALQPARNIISPSYPAQRIDLSNWKLTLPITDPNDPTLPLEIIQPELAAYEMSPWFALAADKKGVIFRAPVNAPTTANSSYPRSELREMTDHGTKDFFWLFTSGTHTLFLDEAITSAPKNKPDVVAGQIHGDNDDLIVIRLEDKKLFVARSRANLVTLDDNYTLGKRFTIKFVAQGGKISVYYDGAADPVYVLDKKVNQAYFKVGAYTQSNCETEGSADLCNSNNYGEVVVYQATATHGN